MSLLTRTIPVGESQEPLAALIERCAGHMHWPIRDLLRGNKPVPSNQKLMRAAALLQTCSAAQVGLAAAWLDLLEVFEAGGLSAKERLEVLIEVLRGDCAGGILPPVGVVAKAAALLPADEVRALVAELDANPPRKNPLWAVVCALPMITAGEPPPAALDRAYLFWAPPAVIRALLEALGPERRERVLVRVMQTDSDNAARVMLESLSFLLDLTDTPVLKQALQRLRQVSASYPEIEELHALLDAGGPTLDADGLSPMARSALEWWFEQQAEVRKAAGAGAMAEHAATVRLAVPGAAELGSLDAWAAATDQRREAIARTVLEAIGKKRFQFDGLQRFDDLPVAIFGHKQKKTKLSLVPGGELNRGLSDEEERKIRALAEAAGLTGTYEEFGQLVDKLLVMRPVQRVRVGPMLIGQGPGLELAPSKLTGWLERGPWRLPTEAEWEYAARGGRAAQLTFRGDDLPLEEWFRETRKLAHRAANRFGLWGFGLAPEVCADLYRAGYGGAPLDGSPVTGRGLRVVRGGAAELYPWQGSGEWHLLLTAMRGSQTGSDHLLAARPVIGLAVGESP